MSCGDLYFEKFRHQYSLLSAYFRHSLSLEADQLDVNSFASLELKRDNFNRALATEIEQCRSRSPHLFATRYSGTFFGIKQAIEADAIVAALKDRQTACKSADDKLRWGTIALGRALLKISNSPGHFAQYLKPKATTYRRYLALRRRSLWAEWLASTACLGPLGDPEWRRGNRAFNQDSLALLPRLARAKAEIGVIYADPPYTNDQYSRFYHLLETLCLYDYPKTTGAGLYRPNRFHTAFSIKSKAAHALQTLVETSAKTGADLILSYPRGGVAIEAGADIPRMLRRNFRRVEVCHSAPQQHSTFGASKGSARAEATEVVYLARSA
ncbi:MAG: hypothetical protein E6K21_19340 [Gammaproteobacteria bacterium]|nr:MAG: hypothetical protein E6K21_19340 [Gammaproteobacteria bacterium]